MKTPKIDWRNGQFGMVYGFVGHQRMFTIDPSERPCTPRMHIGARPKKPKMEAPQNVAEAKKIASAMLINFLKAIKYEEK